MGSGQSVRTDAGTSTIAFICTVAAHATGVAGAVTIYRDGSAYCLHDVLAGGDPAVA